MVKTIIIIISRLEVVASIYTCEGSDFILSCLQILNSES